MLGVFQQQQVCYIFRKFEKKKRHPSLFYHVTCFLLSKVVIIEPTIKIIFSKNSFVFAHRFVVVDIR